MNRFARFGLPVAVLAFAGLATSSARAAGDADLVKKMDEAKVTLAKAIENAQAASKGTATAAMAKMDGDKLAFVVHAVADGKTWEIPVDATGKASAPKELAGDAEKKTHAMPAAELAKAMTGAKWTLGAAITAAEADAKGKAIGVKTVKIGDKMLFDVAVVAGDKTVSVKVDHTTGKVHKAMGG